MEVLESIKNFILVKDIVIWQELFWSSLLIPLTGFLLWKARLWWVYIKPLNSLLRGYRNTQEELLIFLSQKSHASKKSPTDTEWVRTPVPIFLEPYPSPTPTDQNSISYNRKWRIDPVWSETDGICASNVFSTLGEAGIKGNFRIADTIKDWSRINSPIFSIGFNAKTIKSLENDCSPIYYHKLADGTDNIALSIEGSDFSLDSKGRDAGIVQKTFINQSAVPAIILAGLGTTATAAAGYLFLDNASALGKLYGNKAFCILFEASLSKGRKYYNLKAIYPKPSWVRAVFYPLTYWRWYSKKIFPKK